MPCVTCGNDIATQACHVRQSDARFGKKNAMGVRDDDYMLPMCGHCHLGPDGQHDIGEEQWWKKNNIDAVQLAHDLRQCYPDIQRGEDLCYEALLYGYP
jgi:hypothetical protein